MSWNQFEFSTNDGRAVSLYDFSYGDKHYRYTNADRNIEFNEQQWTCIAISDSGLSAGSGNNLEVTVPANNEMVNLYRGLQLSGTVKINIYRFHDSDELKAFKTVWVGSVQEVKREAIDRAKILTSSVASTFSRCGLRLTYGRSCPYSLYDHNCTVQKSQYAFQTTIAEISGVAITVKKITGDEAYFSGGFMRFELDGITELRGLKAQEKKIISVMGGTQGLTAGQKITLYPGCDRTIKTCEQKFNNHLNYGGQPHLPGISPYDVIKLF